jgi:hypothetical protein
MLDSVKRASFSAYIMELFVNYPSMIEALAAVAEVECVFSRGNGRGQSVASLGGLLSARAFSSLVAYLC